MSKAITMKRLSEVSKKVQALQAEYPECLIDLWTPTDIQSVCRDKLTSEQYKTVVSTILQRFDANTGVNWGSIKAALMEVGLFVQD